eukprot:CAMPEP_0177610672 /NCGR_PEP_ID=MMETSP0419_2-20121207/19924_1 /TAXON_ID=582737 /ORGANISM="Tetraselmis sp., Strain GSL018" /LENGTH=236 /DNA_ID=CAMNT_0019106033 /DNA_START=181 /DNA_END=888 /DNA_ORIENTATION=-
MDDEDDFGDLYGDATLDEDETKACTPADAGEAPDLVTLLAGGDDDDFCDLYGDAAPDEDEKPPKTEVSAGLEAGASLPKGACPDSMEDSGKASIPVSYDDDGPGPDLDLEAHDDLYGDQLAIGGMDDGADVKEYGSQGGLGNGGAADENGVGGGGNAHSEEEDDDEDDGLDVKLDEPPPDAYGALQAHGAGKDSGPPGEDKDDDFNIFLDEPSQSAMGGPDAPGAPSSSRHYIRPG